MSKDGDKTVYDLAIKLVDQLEKASSSKDNGEPSKLLMNILVACVAVLTLVMVVGMFIYPTNQIVKIEKQLSDIEERTKILEEQSMKTQEPVRNGQYLPAPQIEIHRQPQAPQLGVIPLPSAKKQ